MTDNFESLIPVTSQHLSEESENGFQHSYGQEIYDMINKFNLSGYVHIEEYVGLRLSTDSVKLHLKFKHIIINKNINDFKSIISKLKELSKDPYDSDKFKKIRNYEKFIDNLLDDLEDICQNLFEFISFISKGIIEDKLNYINDRLIEHIENIEKKMSIQSEHVTNMEDIIYSYKEKICEDIDVNIKMSVKLLEIEFGLIKLVKKIYNWVNKKENLKIIDIKDELCKILEEIEQQTHKNLRDIRNGLVDFRDAVNLSPRVSDQKNHHHHGKNQKDNNYNNKINKNEFENTLKKSMSIYIDDSEDIKLKNSLKNVIWNMLKLYNYYSIQTFQKEEKEREENKHKNKTKNKNNRKNSNGETKNNDNNNNNKRNNNKKGKEKEDKKVRKKEN